MSHKEQLRNQRYGTVINSVSFDQELSLQEAVVEVHRSIEQLFPGVKIQYTKRVFLKEVASHIQKHFPEVDTHYHKDASFMTPDGGFLNLIDENGRKFPILISEKKNQGTNDLRALEGKPRQAQGNAIERLGKNVIGLRALLSDEDIFPFVCFGDGCDFVDSSSILDRVTTIAIFGELNKIYLHDVANLPQFKRGTFYFRAEQWSTEEMYDRCLEIAERSMLYYYSKYGKDVFLK